MSLSFYDGTAAAYFQDTVGADVAPLRARFLKQVRAGGRILDAGCGSGRDARAFSDEGYDVSAFDASAELAKLASAYAGIAVQHLTFAEMDWREAFDGIWASASLLHVPRADLDGIFLRFARALKPNGAWYLSMKLGYGDRLVDGRLFTDITEPELRDRLEALGLHVYDVWCTDDVRPGRSDRWVNAIAVHSSG
ncbi:class I SAM-dependent methyltransferase [Sphingomonas sp. GCM10030256]|uniref:class I SAM-dependent methyltransferase n=1 Tax=Sphingomonas sp. GCM10030256 TaxID=3273427 RepID=UPI003611ACC5